MHIFLVNDDGIGTPGIMALARAATARGHKVSMCAPASQQSAAGQRITLTDPIYVSPRSFEGYDITAYAIQGTPTDCVRLGLLSLVKEPVDLLISGINDGYNSGTAVYYSGTFGAAREGALHHLPAIAASISYHATPTMLEHFAAFVIETAESYRTLTLPADAVLNINAPLREPEDLLPPVFAPMSTATYIDQYLCRESPRAGTYYWLDRGAHTEAFADGSDQDMLKKGHITLTLMGHIAEHNAACAKLVLPQA